MAWTDESKQEAIDMYTAEEPTQKTVWRLSKTLLLN